MESFLIILHWLVSHRVISGSPSGNPLLATQTSFQMLFSRRVGDRRSILMDRPGKLHSAR